MLLIVTYITLTECELVEVRPLFLPELRFYPFHLKVFSESGFLYVSNVNLSRNSVINRNLKLAF